MLHLNIINNVKFFLFCMTVRIQINESKYSNLTLQRWLLWNSCFFFGFKKHRSLYIALISTYCTYVESSHVQRCLGCGTRQNEIMSNVLLTPQAKLFLYRNKIPYGTRTWTIIVWKWFFNKNIYVTQSLVLCVVFYVLIFDNFPMF